MAEYILQRGDRPLHKQLADQIQKQIVEGRIAVGGRLPTVRELAASTGVSRVTVLQAYDLLRLKGLVEARVGAGTFVSEPCDTVSGSSRLKSYSPCSIVADFEETAKSSNIVSLATANADQDLFQEDDFIVGAIPVNGESNYVDHLYGEPRLLSALSAHYRTLGIAVPADDIYVTGGGVAANAAIAAVLGEGGGRFVLQEPLFPYAESYLESFGIRAVGVGTQNGDLDTDRLQQVLAEGDVKAIFVELACSSATGLGASLSNKQEVLRIAERYRVPVIEDVSGSWWRHTDEERPATLWELGADVDVVSCDCLSKLLAQSVAIGAVLASGQLREKLAVRAMGLGSKPPKIMQSALTRYLQTRKMSAHIARVARKYTDRREVMLQSLEAEMPTAVTWTVPAAGFSLWLTLPSSIPDNLFYAEALKKGVAVSPGSCYMTPFRQSSSLRISFGSSSQDEIKRSVSVLSALARSLLQASA